MLHAGKSKHFAERLNKCLDDLGMPTDPSDRSAILSKMLKISRQQTRMLIEGYQLPNEAVLYQLEKELEVDSNWLLK
jgi:hypothetical protein